MKRQIGGPNSHNRFQSRASGSFCHDYCLRRALNLARSTDDACVVVDDYGLLAFVALHFLQFEYGNRANIHTDRVAIAFVQINCDLYHVLSPAKVDRVECFEVISSWFLRALSSARLDSGLESK